MLSIVTPSLRPVTVLPHSFEHAAIFALASLTDWADGYLARRRKQITTLGQLMDPLADKLLITAALVSLVQMDLVPAAKRALLIDNKTCSIDDLRSGIRFVVPRSLRRP